MEITKNQNLQSKERIDLRNKGGYSVEFKETNDNSVSSGDEVKYGNLYHLDV